MADGTDTLRQSLTRLITLVLAVSLTAYLLWTGRDDLEHLRFLQWSQVVGILGLQASYLLTQSERLRLIIRVHTGKPIPLMDWTRLFLVGRLLNTVLMQSGNAYRLIALKRTYGVSYSRYGSSLAAQAWISMSVSLLLAVVLAATVATDIPVPQSFVPTLGVVAVLVVGGPFAATWLGRRNRALSARARWVRGTIHAFERMTDTLLTPAIALRIGAYTLAGFLSGVAILLAAYSAAGIALPVYAAATLLAVMQISNLILLTPGNLGIQELSFAGLTGYLGISPVIGVIASAVVRLSGVAALLIGVLALDAVRASARRGSS